MIKLTLAQMVQSNPGFWHKPNLVEQTEANATTTYETTRGAVSRNGECLLFNSFLEKPLRFLFISIQLNINSIFRV